MSSRSAVAVRASASATPPPSTSSSSGSTSVRSRPRVNRRSALCGSCHGVRPSSAHAAMGDGAPDRPAAGGTTADRRAACRRSSGHPIRGPARAAPSRPGRRACAPSSTGASPRAASSARVAGGARRGLRAAGACRRRRKALARQHIPTSAPARGRVSATARDPACSPWSTISAVVGRSAAATAVSASESGPPDSATHQRSSSIRWALANADTARRNCATGPCRSIVAARRFPLAAAVFRGRTRPC